MRYFLSLMIVLAIAVPSSGADYSRAAFKHWSDLDGDCQDARQEALIAESLIPVTFETEKRCRVDTGLWVCPFTGMVFTDPGVLDVDHLVPLKEAWRSGADRLNPVELELYANYLEDANHLVVVWRSANRSKGAKDPSDWMPANRAYWQEYLRDWINVKWRWDLDSDPDEKEAISKLLSKAKEYVRGDKNPLDK